MSDLDVPTTMVAGIPVPVFTDEAAVQWDMLVADHSTGEPGLCIGAQVVYRFRLIYRVDGLRGVVTAWRSRVPRGYPDDNKWKVSLWSPWAKGDGWVHDVWVSAEELTPILPEAA